MAITLERMPEGYRVWRDKMFLVGIITTKQNYQGASSKHTLTPQEVETHKVGGVVKEPLPADSWDIHLTDPRVNLNVLREIVAALPTEA